VTHSQLQTPTTTSTRPFHALRYLRDDLAALETEGLLRVPGSAAPLGADDARRRCFCSNDYLGLAGHVVRQEASLGSGAARLVSGDHPSHRALEAELQGWLQYPSALSFSSGYAANVGALACLLRPGDTVISDALNHASLIDGIRLSRAKATVVPHLDLAAVRRALAGPRIGRAWVVTESYFSMDGDGPDLAGLRAVCDAADASLYVDEAHALGVFGPEGRGRCAEAGVLADVLVATFGKSLGTSGAAVLGPSDLRLWLWNRARSFVFTTGPSPLVVDATRANVPVVRAADEPRARLAENVAQLRAGLSALGLMPLGMGPIVPVVFGDPVRTVALARRLSVAGFQVSAIRPPTVPSGTSRLRFTVTAHHRADDIRDLLDALRIALA